MSERAVDGDDRLASQGNQGEGQGQNKDSAGWRQAVGHASHAGPSSTNPADYVLDSTIAGRLKRNPDGLVPAVVQDVRTGDVLMLAWMDDHALAYTIATRQGTYWSRSRQEYWVKGLTSGHTQKVADVRLDCDGDTVLLKVEQTGAACHTGDWTCFDAGALL